MCFKGDIGHFTMGPYEVYMVFHNETIRLIQIDEAHTPLLVNEHHLRLHHCPATKDSFIKHFSDNFDLEIVRQRNLPLQL